MRSLVIAIDHRKEPDPNSQQSEATAWVNPRTKARYAKPPLLMLQKGGQPK